MIFLGLLRRFGTALFVVLALNLVLTPPAHAAKKKLKRKAEARRFLGFDSGNQGVGLLVGQPMLARYQYWFNWKRSLFVDVGYDWDRVAIAGASYSFYFYNVDDLWKARSVWNALMFYVGGGLFTGIGVGNADPNDRYQLGVRGYGGVEYLFGGSPWSVKLEVGPKLFVVGRTAAGLQMMLGAVYYFDLGRKRSIPDREFDPPPEVSQEDSRFRGDDAGNDDSRNKDSGDLDFD